MVGRASDGNCGDHRGETVASEAPARVLTVRAVGACARRVGGGGSLTAAPRGLQDVAAVTDNEAVLQQRVTKASNPFLSTLNAPGESQFLTALKPCGILMPHMHMRANEFYTVLSGALPPCRRAGSALRVSGRSSDGPRCRTIRAAGMAQLRMHVMPLHHTVFGTYPGLAVHHAGHACCALRSGESTVTARRGCLIAP